MASPFKETVLLDSELKQSTIDLQENLVRTIHSFFPELGDWMYSVPDPRQQHKIIYDLPILLWLGILLFFFKLEATRNLNYVIGYHSDSNFLDNFKRLFPILGIKQEELDRIPDYGTLIHLFKKLNPESLEELQVKSIKNSIRNRTLEKHRLLGEYYTVAVDGSRIVTFKEQHCKQCLRKKIGIDPESGKIIYEYYHYIVSLCLVSPQGLCLPILTEFSENVDIDPDIEKQDCELKAFYRLAPRLKKHFPNTKFCLLLDSLFENQQVMTICEKYRWKYIVVFKKSIPLLNKEFEAQKAMYPEKSITFPLEGNTYRESFFSNDLEHEGHRLSAIDSTVYAQGPEPKKIKYRRFFTNIFITQKNYREIIKGGATRWKIENEGFNTLKHGGYQLEHLYAHNYTAMKVFCHILLIGFSISQFSKLLIGKKIITKKFGSLKIFYQKIRIVFTERFVPLDLVNTIKFQKYQARLRFT